MMERTVLNGVAILKMRFEIPVASEFADDEDEIRRIAYEGVRQLVEERDVPSKESFALMFDG